MEHKLFRWTLGDLLRRARKDAGLNQSELGEILGVSKSAISSWEANRTAPSIREFFGIVEATGDEGLVLAANVMIRDEIRGVEHEVFWPVGSRLPREAQEAPGILR